ncbi:metal-dependent hydrolase [Marinigracilibium pacificum]|uniref:Metal-dependent hydrolase n=1 Tax=Marinigracilibium pacificum TaxID=2729599 RepID=A0A848J3H7_9BACT|nr:metal-dependent hydrolase [Marinigracilibium pacificum]NMM50281.1 metal-dependent hydrolase [Marinigracilibium pacificum]
MDSLTQAVLGAAVGESVLGPKIGRKASILGALAGTLPDLDVFIQSGLNTVDGLLFHRGPSHSLLFALIASLLLGWIAYYFQKQKSVSYQNWFIFFLLTIFTHPLLDAFTNYGTEIFWPFLDTRIAFRTIFVVDPMYTIWLVMAVVFLLFYKKATVIRRKIALGSLIISSMFLMLTVYHKYHVDKKVVEKLQEQNYKYERIMTVPSPLCNWLWTVIIDEGDQYTAGYYSMLIADQDFKDVTIKKSEVPEWLKDSEEYEGLEHFSDGWIIVKENSTGSLTVDDIRFGPLLGWYNPDSGFIFSFDVKNEGDAIDVKKIEEEPDGELTSELGKLWDRIWTTDRS